MQHSLANSHLTPTPSYILAIQEAGESEQGLEG